MKITDLTRFLLALALVGCNGKDETTDSGTSDATTDNGGDADVDADSDADADADVDADSDADTDTTPTGDFTFATDPASAYTRVDRMGMPAIATAVITDDDAYNASNPADDVAGTYVADITANVAFLHGALDDDLVSLSLHPCGGPPPAPVAVCIAQAGPLVIPDTLKVDPAAPSGFPNGRKLADPVIDLTLAVILLDLSQDALTTFSGLPLNPPANDVAFPATFPYLAAAH